MSLLLALSALALPGSALAVDTLQWTLTPKSPGQPLGAQPYRLGGAWGSLRYGHRVVGVQLVWGGGTNEWELRHNSPSGVRDHRSILPTEAVALYNRTYRRYLVRTLPTLSPQMNLGWATPPFGALYQWKVYEGRNQSGVVRLKLYNTVEPGYLVYGHQTFGINLVFLHAPYTTP